MSKNNPFKEQDGSFRLTLPIKKSYTKDIDGVSHMYIAGLASGTGLDHHGEKMAKTAIQAFQKAITEGIYLPDGESSHIPLRSGHRDEWDDVLGYVTKAEIDDDSNLWIEAELDDTSSHARDLFMKLNSPPRPNKPLKLGFSVGGRIKKYSYDFDETLKQRVKVIEDVLLREISVVGSPAYPTAYVEALEKSVNWDEISEQVQESNMTKTDVQATEVADESTQKTEEVAKHDTTATENTTTTADTNEVDASLVKNTEEATKADSQVETDVTKSIPEVLALETKVTELAKNVETLTASLETLATTLVKSVEANATAKAEEKTEVVETNVEKSIEDKVASAVATILESFKKEFSTDLATLKTSVEEIASQPMDKSLAVGGSKEEGVDDPLVKLKTRIDGGESILKATIAEAIRQK